MNKRTTGKKYEEVAVRNLELKGFEILDTNFRCHMGEIDIIAKDNKYLCFIEVKYRTNTGFGYAQEAVNKKKIETITKVASYYLKVKKMPQNTPVRFDVVAINGHEIDLIKNAFGGF